jgi:hypothetical protein
VDVGAMQKSLNRTQSDEETGAPLIAAAAAGSCCNTFDIVDGLTAENWKNENSIKICNLKFYTVETK